MEKKLVKNHLIWLLLAAWVYTLTFIFNNYWSKYASYASATKSFQQSVTKRERQFHSWATDTALLSQLSNGINSPRSLGEIKKLPFSVFIFDASKPDVPVFWSTNAVLPDPYHVSYYPSGSFVKYGNGQYEMLKKELSLNGRRMVLVGFLQLHEEFFIENGMLRKEYPGFPGLGEKMDLSTFPTPYGIKGENGKPIIYFKPNVPEPIYVFNWLSFFIQIVATVFLLIYITKSVSRLIKKNFYAGIILFSALYLLLRWSVFTYGIPIDLRQFPLFADETVVNMSGSRQLREYMLHALFGLWAGVFLTRHSPIILQMMGKMHKAAKWVLVCLLCLGVTAGHFKLVNMVRNLYLNSTIAFDLTNFLSFNVTTVFSFLIIFLFCVSHYMMLRFLVVSIMRLNVASYWVILIILTLSGLFWLSVIPAKAVVFALLAALVWLLLYFLAGLTHIIKPALNSSGLIVAWLFIYSISLSIFLSFLSDSRLHTRAGNIAKSLLLQKDETSEKLVRIAAHRINRINWAELMESCRSETMCHELKDSLVDEYFSGYLNRFNTSIYLFDINKTGVYNSGDVTYESLNTLFNTQANLLNNENNLRYFGETFDQFGYIIRNEVRNENDNNLVGYMFIMVRSLRSGNQAFSPQLFRQLQNFAINLPQDYSYAWYKNGTLVEQFRNYPFQTNLPAAMRGAQSLWENKKPESFELWLNAGSGTVLALAAQRSVFISFISMLAYLFGAFLIFYSLYAAIYTLANGRLYLSNAYERLHLNLQTKIRLTIVVILTISFVIVAVVTISFFVTQFKNDNTEKLAQSVQSISAELARKLPANYASLKPSAQKMVMQTTLMGITKRQNADVNCFDSTGLIVASTQSILYDKGVLSPMVDPIVWWNLTKGEVHRYISTENIGNLSYSSIYQPLLNNENRVLLYLQVPYFASQSELNREISNFLVILINIIAFVFLLSGSLAYWISGSITKSFNVIAEKMNRIRLSEHNERIEWTPKDEIGNLVFQYNKMVDQLEDSVKKMAKTEREMAWREMARQVAHEIKNPLTPMKLSLQFLQKAIKENNTDVLQITEKVAGNLVGQIDHLSKIATDFSQFANLGTYKPELFNLQLTLREVVQMYEMQEDLSLRWHSLSEPLNILADKTQINRLFTNLLQNASESTGKTRTVHIIIGEKLVPGSVIISFSDNGEGIAESARKNIFTPNFTTKSSGTGLGLSICKAIVENAGGTIWFETEAGIGTTFYIRLPLAR